MKALVLIVLNLVRVGLFAFLRLWLPTYHQDRHLGFTSLAAAITRGNLFLVLIKLIL